MDNGWLKTTLGELCDRGQAMIQTGPFGSQLHSYDYQTAGVPVVPTEAIARRRIGDDAIPRVSEAVVNRLARHKLRAGDILFARRVHKQPDSQRLLSRNMKAGFAVRVRF